MDDEVDVDDEEADEQPKNKQPRTTPLLLYIGRSARAVIVTLRAVVEKVKLYKAWHLVEKSAAWRRDAPLVSTTDRRIPVRWT